MDLSDRSFGYNVLHTNYRSSVRDLIRDSRIDDTVNIESPRVFEVGCISAKFRLYQASSPVSNTSSRCLGINLRHEKI